MCKEWQKIISQNIYVISHKIITTWKQSFRFIWEKPEILISQYMSFWKIA